MISLEPFAQQHLYDAARLFVDAYATQRAETGCLPYKYQEPEAVARLLEGMIEANPGVVAIANGKLAGYLAGYAGIPNFKGISPGVYVPEWAHAVREDGTKEVVFQSMYDRLARDWARAGCFTHAITSFAVDKATRDLLYWNGFGLLVIDAIREALPNDGSGDLGAIEPGIAIRPARHEDLEELARLDRELREYLSRPPVFLAIVGEHDEGVAGQFLGDDVVSIVAERDGRLLACIRGTAQKEDACTVVRDASVMGINFAYTDPGARGMGLGTRMLAEVLRWGRARQKTACAVDFESANPLGRSFWLRHFSAVCFSTIRVADPRAV